MIRFRRLEMERFRAFSRRALEFGDGLNVILGANEAGKTTVHEALRTVLFVKPNTRAQAVQANRSWDHDSMFVLTLEFEAGGRSYRLVKDFEARRALLEDLDAGEAWRDPDTIQEILEDRLGLGPQAVYTRLAWINHDEMSRLADGPRGGAGGRREAGRGGDPLLERLQAAVVGGGGARSTDEVLALARQRLADLRKGLDRPARDPGPLRRYRDQMAELDRRLAQLQAQAQQADAARRVLAEVTQALADIEQRLPQLQQVLDANRRLHDLERQRAALQQAYEEESSRLARVREASAGREAAVRELQRLEGTELPGDEEMRRLRSLDAQVKGFDEALAARPEAAAAGSTGPTGRIPAGGAPAGGGPVPGPNPLLRAAGFVLVLLGAAVAVAGLAGLDLPLLGGSPGTSGAAAALLALLGLLLVWRSTRGGAAAPVPVQPDPLAELRARRDEAAAALAEGLQRWGAPSLETLEAAIARLDAAQSALQAAEQRLADLLAGGTVEALDRRIDEIRRDLRDLDDQIARLQVYRLDPQAFAAGERQAAELERRRDDLQQRERQAQLDLVRSEVDPEEMYTLEETRQVLAARLQRLEDHAAALTILVDELEAARSELLSDVGRRIAAAAEPFVAPMTGGRYTGLVVEEDLSDVAVLAPGREEPIPWRDLSRGTQDQVYFALRLGLIHLIYGDTPPPLLLDDPFLTFDDRRAAAAMALLRRRAEQGQQVILLTYSPRYEEPWSAAVIHLTP